MALSFINNGEGGQSVRNKLNDRWQVLAHSTSPASCGADTSEDVLATITVPGGSMGANGRLRVITCWTTTNSSNNKTLRVRFSGASGTIFGSIVATTSASYRVSNDIANRNSASAQVGGVAGGSGGWGSSSSAIPTSSVDTSVDTTIVITGQKASAGETLTLESYMVELLHGA